MIPTRKQKVARSIIAETGTIPAGMQLIRDVHHFQVLDTKNAITEDRNGKEMQILRVTGLFQEGDKPNHNGRIYSSKDILAPAVRQIQEDVRNRAVLGEYDHPSDAKIHLDRVSHLISNVWMEGKKVYGEAEVLHKLPLGACLRGLFEHKARVGISSRGVGDMEVMEHNGQELYNVLEGFSFVTWDVVSEPSVSGAILNIQESLQKHLKQSLKKNSPFPKETYEKMLVGEINKFFNLK